MPVVTTGYEPHLFQAEVHANMRRFSVLVCHRRFGKTVLAINALIDDALRIQRENARYGYVAPFRNQAKSIAWTYLKQYTESIPGTTINESELFVTLPNNAQIRLFGADHPDSLRGLYFDGIVMDEVADMKPQIWGEVVRPALSDRKGWCLFIGTPKGINLFYELYQQAVSDPDWFAGFYDIGKTLDALPWLDDDEVRASRDTMTESQAAQEWDCDFQASCEGVLIPLDLVNLRRGAHVAPNLYEHAPKIVGVDVARFGGDHSVVACRQGLAAFTLKKALGFDTEQVAGMAAHAYNAMDAEALMVDGVGVGAGVVDRLRTMGYKVIDVQSGATATDAHLYANKRAEMWVRMRDWLQDGGCIPDDPQLCMELTSVEYWFSSSDKIVLERKEHMKGRGLPSPDCADALAMTFAEHIRSRRVDYGPSIRERGRARVYAGGRRKAGARR